MANVSVFCFLASYLVAFGLELTRLLRSTAINRAIMLLFGTAGLIAHTIYLLGRGGKTNLPPLLSSAHDWMLVLAWLAILFYLCLTTFERELPVGLFLLPVVLLLIGAANFVSHSTNPLVDDAIRGWTMLHVSLLVFGVTGVLVGFVLSLMYVAQHHRLKHKQTMQSGLALPSLARLARLNWWAVIISVPLLMAGMIAGFVLAFYSRQGEVPITPSDPVVIVNGALMAGMLGFLVWLTRKHHAGGRQVAWLTIWAFGFLLVTVIGLQVLTGKGVLETGHTLLPSFVPFVSG